MNPLQDSDHMVQKPPYWNANYPVGHLKQRKFRLTSFVLDVPVCNLRSNMAVFVPCDHYPAKGPLVTHVGGDWRSWSFKELLEALRKWTATDAIVKGSEKGNPTKGDHLPKRPIV